MSLLVMHVVALILHQLIARHHLVHADGQLDAHGRALKGGAHLLAQLLCGEGAV